MAIFLRITALGISVVAGFALAISVATRSEPWQLPAPIAFLSDTSGGQADKDRPDLSSSDPQPKEQRRRAPSNGSLQRGDHPDRHSVQERSFEDVEHFTATRSQELPARSFQGYGRSDHNREQSTWQAAEDGPRVANSGSQPIQGPYTSSPNPANRAAPAHPMPYAPGAPWSYAATFPVHTWGPTAAYEPAVANPFAFFREALEKIQQQQSRTEEALSRLKDELPLRGAMTADAPSLVSPPSELVPLSPAVPTATVDVAQTEPKEVLPPGRQEPQLTVGDGDELSINLQNSDVREVLRLLSEVSGLNILASPNVQGTVSASLERVDVKSALAAILRSSGFTSRHEQNFIFVGTPAELDEMNHLDDVVSTRVYRPNYVSAAELQKLITPMLTPAAGHISVSTIPEIGIASDAVNAGGDSYAGGEVVLVRDFEMVLAEVDQIVQEVDQMPLQVAIEATILSVKLDDKNELGVDFELLREKDTIRVVSGNALDSLITASFQEGLKIGFLDSTLFAFVEALETIGDTSVIASPRVMCLNKQRAEILIGSELGYVSTTVTETSATQSVEFLEVGTHLRIRPFVSSDGMVRMEVHPELSQGSVRVEGGFTLPDKEVTQVTTNIMCRTGATIVIGGLIREDLNASASQIPVLGNLPVVGALFRQRTEETDRREIIVLLTPRIITEPEMWQEGQHYAEQFYDRRDVFQDKMSPLGKRTIGERLLRLARAAWNAGDPDTALRNVNRAIHFDPLNQGAINLRREILAVAPELEMSVDENLQHGLAPFHGPKVDYSKRGYPWKYSDEVYEDLHAVPVPVDEPIPLAPPEQARELRRSNDARVAATPVSGSSRRMKKPVKTRISDQSERKAVAEPRIFQPTPAVRPVSHEAPIEAKPEPKLRLPVLDLREG